MGELAKRFGGRVRELRKAASVTQAELADRASISEEWLRRIERGAASPSFTVVEGLARALGVEVAVLLDGTTDGPAQTLLHSRIHQLDAEEQASLLGIVDQLLRRPRRR